MGEGKGTEFINEKQERERESDKKGESFLREKKKESFFFFTFRERGGLSLIGFLFCWKQSTTRRDPLQS